MFLFCFKMSSSFSSSLLYSLANTTTVAEAVFTAAVGVVVGLAALLFSFHIATRRPVIPLPHPPLQPIFGNLLQQIKQGSRRNEYFSELHERLGMNFTFCIPLLTVRASIVVTAKPENVEHVLKTNFQVYDKGQQLHGKA